MTASETDHLIGINYVNHR